MTRGRANTLRLALSGQIGAPGLEDPAVMEALQLCLSCKACRRECPTGVDMARMKIEVLAARNRARGVPIGDRLIAHLPRYAPWAARLAPLANLRNRVPALAALGERVLGLSAKRALPQWHRRPFRHGRPTLPTRNEMPYAVFATGSGAGRRPVALLADTFNTYFEPANLEATVGVLERLGYEVEPLAPADGGRPLCCGRTYLAAGMVEEARAEARRLIEAARPHLERGAPIVGIEPSCLLTLRDEMQVMGLGPEAQKLGSEALLLEELIARDAANGQIRGPIGRLARTVHLHGHCHQKSFDAVAPIERTLGLIEGLEVRMIEAGCCGMAGAFGYGAETHATSMRIGESALLPAVRAAASDAMIAADGFSCRHQIRDGARREAVHVARLLAEALGVGEAGTPGSSPRET